MVVYSFLSGVQRIVQAIPTRLKESTNNKIEAPGHTAIHDALSM
jgi:hypothetical protein